MNAYDRERLSREMEAEYRQTMKGCRGFVITAIVIAVFTLGVVLAFSIGHGIGSLISTL